MSITNLLSKDGGGIHRRHKQDRVTIGLICNKHGFVLGVCCSQCSPDNEHNKSMNIITNDWVKDYWEHIDKEPIYIESKEHLFEECEKRGVMPRAFMKPRSSGNGFEIKRR